MKDRFMRGFISGVAAGISMTVFNYLLILTTPVKYRFADYMSILIYGGMHESIWELLIAMAFHFAFAGLLGVLFVYLIPVISSRYYYLKAVIYGVSVWFAIFGIGTLFRLPLLDQPTLVATISKSLVSGFYGLVLAWAAKKLLNTTKA